MPSLRSLALPAVAGLALVACSAVDAPTGSSGDAQLRFKLTTAAGGTSSAAARGLAASAGRAPVTYSDGSNTLVIEQVEIVLRDVELERIDTSRACPDDRGGRDSSRSGDDDGRDACEKITAGPVLLDLPLGEGAVATAITMAVDTGHFDEVEFEVHKPSDDTAEDRAFLQQHPDFDDVSIRVRGTWNGAPFTFTTDDNFEQEIRLSPPLVVAEQTTVDLTLRVDVSTWFRDGSRLIDPATANKGGDNDDVVEENIERSFEVK